MEFFLTSTILAIIFLIALFLYIPGNGKFWHKHDWYEYVTVRTPSFYSRDKINIHTAFKCSNCSAFKVETVTVKESSERV